MAPKMRFKDYYKILGVSEKAPPEEIKKSYRRLAKQYHPDANPGDKAAEERFKEINEAYDIIGDAEKRHKYDQLRFYGRPDATTNGEWFSFDPEFLRSHGFGMPGMGGHSPFGSFFGQGFAFSDLLRDLFGFNGIYSDPTPTHTAARNITGKIRISFLEAVRGTERTISIRQKKTCPVCQGKGQEGYAPCSRCNGSGQISSKKKIRIRLPAGVESGHQLRLRGLAAESSHGPAGDVIINVEVEPHPHFTRAGADIYFETHVDEPALKAGTRLRIPTIAGKLVELNVPAGTKRGTVFRLRNFGVKTPNRVGDQFIKVV